MNRSELIKNIKSKRSFLCVGLDTDLTKIPKHLLETEDPIFEFNKQIIDATKDFCVAYKPNSAFYEAHGAKGWESLKKTIDYIPDDQFVIADSKRGDIGNTAKMYAKSVFEDLGADSITVAPYMGEDSVKPFLEFEGKWAIVLALTSNQGALDFQFLQMDVSKSRLFEKVLTKTQGWGTPANLMYVVGATRADMLEKVRDIVPDHFLLIPGVGAQGGSLKDVAKYGMNADCGLLVNSSRGIIYAGQGEDFAQKAAEEAQSIQIQMSDLLAEKGVI